MLPYVGTKLSVFERDIRHKTEKAFYPGTPRIVFKSSSMLIPKG